MLIVGILLLRLVLFVATTPPSSCLAFATQQAPRSLVATTKLSRGKTAATASSIGDFAHPLWPRKQPAATTADLTTTALLAMNAKTTAAAAVGSTTTSSSSLWPRSVAAAATFWESRRPSRLQVVVWVLAALLLREWWSKVPLWLRNLLLLPYRKLVVAPVKRLQRRLYGTSTSSSQPVKAVADSRSNSTTDRTGTSAAGETLKLKKVKNSQQKEALFGDDDDDMEDNTIVQKLQKIMALAQSVATNAVHFEAFQMEFALFVMLQMVEQSKRKTAQLWDDFYQSSGEPFLIPKSSSTAVETDDDDDVVEATPPITTSSDEPTRAHVIHTLIDQLHLSDWAYLEETEDIRAKLQELNNNSTNYQWHLVRHVKTNEPGRVGHYIAIDSKSKVALISVKGTSALSDMVTDACGVPIRYNVTTIETDDDGNEQEGETTLLSCHEGILDASLALVEDVQPLVENLFLPSGYRTVLMGHSLGAGVACMVGTFLRARIPALRQPQQQEHDSSKAQPLLEVLAFAPPPMLNWEAAVATSPYTTSIVNNDDMIPRASLSNLVSLLRFLAIVNTRLEEKGLSPTGLQGTVKLLKKVLVDSDSNRDDDESSDDTIMSAQEIFDGLNEARSSQDVVDAIDESKNVLKDEMDHLFVPGKVIIVYEKHAKDEKGVDVPVATNVESTVDSSSATEELLTELTEGTLMNAAEKSGSLVDEMRAFATEMLPKAKPEEPEVPIEAGAIVADGAAAVLRHINVNDRMFSDHMPDAYEKTLRALL